MALYSLFWILTIEEMVNKNGRKQKVNGFEWNIIEAVKNIQRMRTKIVHFPLIRYVEKIFLWMLKADVLFILNSHLFFLFARIDVE